MCGKLLFDNLYISSLFKISRPSLKLLVHCKTPAAFFAHNGRRGQVPHATLSHGRQVFQLLDILKSAESRSLASEITVGLIRTFLSTFSRVRSSLSPMNSLTPAGGGASTAPSNHGPPVLTVSARSDRFRPRMPHIGLHCCLPAKSRLASCHVLVRMCGIPPFKDVYIPNLFEKISRPLVEFLISSKPAVAFSLNSGYRAQNSMSSYLSTAATDFSYRSCRTMVVNPIQRVTIAAHRNHQRFEKNSSEYLRPPTEQSFETKRV